ncbi:hypothetical protein V8G54_010902 [Vigna mungo]|uniref:Myotubularin phosphatase domain-containing protein n=1 Tax=Vigna mungo TaxID=3915 RepID=A0AAQ3NYU8_VIGMU
MQGKCVFFVFVSECAGCGVIWSNFLHFLKPVSKLYFKKLYVVDARPRKNALANGAMGGGLELSSNYFQSIVLLGIDNIHAKRQICSALKIHGHSWQSIIRWTVLFLG